MSNINCTPEFFISFTLHFCEKDVIVIQIPDSEDLVINGSKMWITNGAEADWICLLATTNDGLSHRNKSLICVPMDTPGVTVARKIDKLG